MMKTSALVAALLSLLPLTIEASSLQQEQPVLVELYYESLCPGCRHFITSLLFETWKALKNTGDLDIGLYPYGNAHETKQPDGSYKFQCQHGKSECTGNLLEVCIMKKVGFDSSVYLPVIECMEASADPVESAQGCVQNFLPKLNFQSIQDCAQGQEGNRLMHKMAEKTESLNPPHNFVPWIVVNGKHTAEIQLAAMNDLKGLVCSMISGSKPEQCTKGKLASLYSVFIGRVASLPWLN